MVGTGVVVKWAEGRGGLCPVGTPTGDCPHLGGRHGPRRPGGKGCPGTHCCGGHNRGGLLPVEEGERSADRPTRLPSPPGSQPPRRAFLKHPSIAILKFPAHLSPQPLTELHCLWQQQTPNAGLARLSNLNMFWAFSNVFKTWLSHADCR